MNEHCYAKEHDGQNSSFMNEEIHEILQNARTFSNQPNPEKFFLEKKACFERLVYP